MVNKALELLCPCSTNEDYQHDTTCEGQGLETCTRAMSGFLLMLSVFQGLYGALLKWA